MLGGGAATALADPATDFAPGSAPMEGAQQIARAHWGGDACGGQVTISWMALSGSTNATSRWGNPVGQYLAPEQNTNCLIAFNSAIAWDFTRFCSVLVHEYGHLTGQPHSSDAGDLMYPYYVKPLDECVAAAPAQAPADEAAFAAALRQSTTAPTAPTASTVATTTPPKAHVTVHHPRNRGVIVLVRHPHFHTTNHSRHRAHRHLSAKQRRHAHWLVLMARYHHRHHG